MMAPTGLVALILIAFTVGLWTLSPPSAGFLAEGGLTRTRIEGDHFPLRLIDPIGREHRLEHPPRRILSGILSGDEMLADLVETDRVVGVTYLVDDEGISNVRNHYPREIARHHAEIEEVLALQPDLVLVSSLSNAVTVRLLLRSGVAVVRLPDANSFEEIAGNLQMLGRLTGAPERARGMVADMRRRIRAVTARVQGLPPPRVLYYSQSGATAGAGSLTDEMIQLGGGYNVIRDTGIRGFGRISPELAIALQPDVLILSDWSAIHGASAAEELRRDPAWRAAPAVRTGQVHSIHGAWVTSGSQHRVKGVEILARLLHPEAFQAPAGSSPADPTAAGGRLPALPIPVPSGNVPARFPIRKGPDHLRPRPRIGSRLDEAASHSLHRQTLGRVSGPPGHPSPDREALSIGVSRGPSS